MADIDQIIAGGAGASSRADFSGIPKLLDSYWAGKDQAAKNDLREAFKGGVPTLPDGSLDISSVMKTLFQKGDVAGGVGLAGAASGAADRAALGNVDGLQPGPQAQQAPIVSPSVNRQVPIAGNAPVRAAPAGTAQPAAPQGQDSQPTVMKILAAQGIPNDQLGAASASVARQLNVDPTAPIDISDPQVRNVLVPALAQIKKMGLGQVQPPQPGDNQPPQVAQAQPPQMAPQPMQASPDQQAAQNDPILKRLTLLTASPDKATAAAAKVRLESYLKNRESTTEMKNAAASGMDLPAYQEKQGELAAQQAGATERAKNDVTEQKTYIDNGRVAQQRLGTLNTLSNIISTDKNLNLGFGSETTLKVKMALEKAGFDVGDLSGAQMIQKMNGILASESTKSLATRPTQFEFKTFLGNNPGLALDEKGNIRMLGILSQNAKREVDLGKLARKNQDNWDNWDNVVEAYDKKNPIKDPTTGKILSSSSIIAPAIAKGATPASGSAQAAPAAFPNAKQAPDGNWYVPDPARPGKYSKVVQ
jgi:hypothetical protein